MKTDSIRNIIVGLLLQVTFTGFISAQQKMLPEFNAIKVNGVFNIYLTQSDSNYIKLEGDSSSFNKIKAEVENGILLLSPSAKLKDGKLQVYVGVKKLNKVQVNGPSDLKGLSPITTDTLGIIASGTGDIILNVKADKVIARASGTGDIRLSGNSKEFEADASGAGDIKAFELVTENAKVRASGAGDIRLNVKSKLDAQTSGAGDIQYKGNPEDRTVNISGAGDIRQARADAKETDGDTTRIRVGNKKLIIVSSDDGMDGDDPDVDVKWEDNDNDGDDHEHHEHGEHRKHDAPQEHRKHRGHKDKQKGDFSHWTGIYIASTGYLNPNYELSIPANFDFLELDYSKSLSFGINFLEKNIHIYKNYINLVTGLGIEFNGYGFKNNITLRPDTNYVAAIKNTQADFSKNKLRTTMLHLPLMFEFNSRLDRDGKPYHIAIGAILGYKITSQTKQVYELNGKKYKEKVRDDYNLAPFRYSATIRAGYGDFTLFANYALSEFFEKNKGPQLYPFSIGINLSL